MHKLSPEQQFRKVTSKDSQNVTFEMLQASHKWDTQFCAKRMVGLQTHAETKKERAQYYKTKIKAIQKCLLILSIIIDAMDQNKTRIPYFDRPDKCIASEQGLKTKLFAAIVHGFRVYLFKIGVLHSSKLVQI